MTQLSVSHCIVRGACLGRPEHGVPMNIKVLQASIHFMLYGGSKFDRILEKYRHFSVGIDSVNYTFNFRMSSECEDIECEQRI